LTAAAAAAAAAAAGAAAAAATTTTTTDKASGCLMRPSCPQNAAFPVIPGVRWDAMVDDYYENLLLGLSRIPI
jgi:hypothetical protein